MEPILLSCLKCSAEIPADNSFCGKCGAPVTVSPFDHLIIPQVTALHSQPAYSKSFVATMRFLGLFGGAILIPAFISYFFGGPPGSYPSWAPPAPTALAQTALYDSEQAIKSSKAAWHKVLTLTGNGAEDTQTFNIKSDKWVIDWTTKPNLLGKTFAIVVKRPGGRWMKLAAYATGEKSGRTVIHRSGDFYLEISGTQSFTVTVSDYS